MLALVLIAWLGPVAGAALIPPKVVTVEVVTADPVPPPLPLKPVARAIAAVKHALVTNRSPKVQPTPAPPEPTPAPPAAQPEAPPAPVQAAETPNPQPAAAERKPSREETSISDAEAPRAPAPVRTWPRSVRAPRR